jgi:hypothetical protein
MLQTTYEAILQPNGHLQFLESPQQVKKARRVLLTFTEESDSALCVLQLSEQVLARDWLTRRRGCRMDAFINSKRTKQWTKLT